MSDLSHAHSPIEHAVENICANLLKKSTDFWEDRNKAMLELTRIICKFEGATPATLHEVFNINVYRALIEPVKQMILDLRSQQVRDTCIFLTHLAKITGDLMRFFLRDTFESIFIAVKVPNKVMSGYVDECIVSMLQNTTFKSAIPVIIGEYRESKSKACREKCLVYLNVILTHWDLIDKEGDQISDTIRLGLEDASMKGREFAREAFISFKHIFPEKAEELKATLAPSILSRVVKAETKYENRKRTHQHKNHQTKSHHSSRTSSDDDLDMIISKSTPRTRERDDNNAVSSIEELIRNNSERSISRRSSNRKALLESQTGNASGDYLDDNMEPVVLNRGSNEYRDPNNINIPLYLQQPPVTLDSNNLSPRPTTWYDSDQISPLTMDNGRGGSPEKVGRHSNENGRILTKTSSANDMKTTSLSMTDTLTEVRDLSDLQLGMRVVVKDKVPAIYGVVEFVGQTSFASGMWVGLRLESPMGKNNGTVHGVKYFQCSPLHGLFVRPQHLLIVVTRVVESVKAIEMTSAQPESTNSRRSLNNKHESPSRTNAEKLRATLNIAHALKVKISKEMHLLNQQLEMVELLESQVQGIEGVKQEDCAEFVNALIDVTYEEEHMCKDFRKLIQGQQQLM